MRWVWVLLLLASGGFTGGLVVNTINDGDPAVTEDCAAQWAAFNDAFSYYDDPTDNGVYDIDPIIAAYDEAKRLCGDGFADLNTNTVERQADIDWQVYGIGEEHPS